MIKPQGHRWSIYARERLLELHGGGDGLKALRLSDFLSLMWFGNADTSETDSPPVTKQPDHSPFKHKGLNYIYDLFIIGSLYLLSNLPPLSSKLSAGVGICISIIAHVLQTMLTFRYVKIGNDLATMKLKVDTVLVVMR
ncbi:hypothetical protein XELAEV_18030204mg [Xenopus laevis]|uniref:Uncharacterized protein n=1 Tax=Xenopus laevis TaxID=8355 RepID=A0A974CV59_XENLA|nr:hypothetical protein XELAEV_18030204mg [Xenopus laevis]